MLLFLFHKDGSSTRAEISSTRLMLESWRRACSWCSRKSSEGEADDGDGGTDIGGEGPSLIFSFPGSRHFLLF